MFGFHVVTRGKRNVCSGAVLERSEFEASNAQTHQSVEVQNFSFMSRKISYLDKYFKHSRAFGAIVIQTAFEYERLVE